jgi:hypothetical protein
VHAVIVRFAGSAGRFRFAGSAGRFRFAGSAGRFRFAGSAGRFRFGRTTIPTAIAQFLVHMLCHPDALV